MATAKKRGANWRIQVKQNGVRKTGTFPTKAAANAWAAKIQTEIADGKSGNIPNKKFRELLERYATEVSIHKRGEQWEIVRLAALSKMEIADVNLRDLNETHFAKWRDQRLKAVSAATVLREWNLLSAVVNVAIKEWLWLRDNPLKQIKRPDKPEARKRRISDNEIERLCFALGYDENARPESITARVGAALCFALETAMRTAEIVALTWAHVHDRHVHLPKTKNGFARDVPLSPKAKAILEQVREGKGSVFRVTEQQIDALFRKAKARALIEDLHFHDSRREALTRLSKVYGVMELAKISGHRDLRILQDVYYAPSIEDLANKLSKN